MNPNILIKDGKKYLDEYVAMASFNDRKVIAHGRDFKKVYAKAITKAESPVIVYVSKGPYVYQIA